MDLDFGHGFVPRIGEGNYKAVDRCVGPADLFNADPLVLPWAIVDGAWAEGRIDLLGALRQHGTNVMVDTAGWRFRYPATAEVLKLRSASWSPEAVVSVADPAAVGMLVHKSLLAQAALGADAYLVPGWLPESPDEDLRPVGGRSVLRRGRAAVGHRARRRTVDSAVSLQQTRRRPSICAVASAAHRPGWDNGGRGEGTRRLHLSRLTGTRRCRSAAGPRG